VDGLQQKALAESHSDMLHGTPSGSRSVVELHGNLARVVCLDCGDRTSRLQLADRLHEANPHFAAQVTAVNPDGDADLGDGDLAGFRTVDCLGCGGLLKPDVVFFGEMVPRERVQHSFALVERSRLVLVLGSSLTVMSGRRFVLRAVKRGIPVAIVNQGPTRGDDCATLTLDAPLGSALPQLVRLLAAEPLPA
jgi:NAD-dependent SIR2 family protein deacetylase